jgi:hypothetical protein
MDSSRSDPGSSLAQASVALCAIAVPTVAFIPSRDIPGLLQFLAIVPIGLGSFLLARMVAVRASGDRNWGAPSYSVVRAHVILWSSLCASALAIWQWVRHYS